MHTRTLTHYTLITHTPGQSERQGQARALAAKGIGTAEDGGKVGLGVWCGEEGQEGRAEGFGIWGRARHPHNTHRA